MSGNLTWTIDIDNNTTAAEIISSKEYTYLPMEQENHFFLRFNNTDLESSPFTIMANDISISYEKKYFNI